MNRLAYIPCSLLIVACGPGVIRGGDTDEQGGDTTLAGSEGTGSAETEPGESESGPADTSESGDGEVTDESGGVADIQAPVCGDGLVELPEVCDDGNAQPDDGCDPDCVRSAAVEVVAGHGTTCVRTRSGAVRCWGWNLQGQLGYGHTQNIGDDETPASAGDVSLGGRAIDLGLADIGCAVLEDHTLRCWGGQGWNGQLGYGTVDDVGDDETPDQAGPVPVGAPVVEVEVVRYRTCVVTEDQELRCWGIGDDLGYGMGTDYILGDDETPAELGSINVGDPVIGVSAGYNVVCALLDSQDLRCWGTDEEKKGVLGYGILGPLYVPPLAQVVPVGGPVVRVCGNDDRMCALLDGGGVRCWGFNHDPPLGYGLNDFAIGDDETPAEVGDLDLGGPAISISVGGVHTCAVLEGGAVRCWGTAGPWLGNLATEDIGDDESPASVPPIELGAPAVQVAAGNLHACALLETGAVRCWGFNSTGALGYGHTENIGDDETPATAGDVPLF